MNYKYTPALFKEHPKRKANYIQVLSILPDVNQLLSSGPPPPASL
jgi:hypothetical protein